MWVGSVEYEMIYAHELGFSWRDWWVFHSKEICCCSGIQRCSQNPITGSTLGHFNAVQLLTTCFITPVLILSFNLILWIPSCAFSSVCQNVYVLFLFPSHVLHALLTASSFILSHLTIIKWRLWHGRDGWHWLLLI